MRANSGDTAPPTTQELPWGVEIASGTRCLRRTGAGDLDSVLPATHYCPNGNVLYGDPSRGLTWHIGFSAKPTNRPAPQVALTRVWF